MKGESYKIGDLAARFGAELQGDATTLVTGVASISSARQGDLVFASDEDKFQQALDSRATAIATGRFANTLRRDKPFLIADNPKLLFARIAAQLYQQTAVEGHDESAQIHVTAQIGEHTFIGPGVVIEEGACVGDYTTVGANSVIGKNAQIGSHCRIDPNVTIYAEARLGDRVIIQAGTVLGSTGFGYVQDERGRHQLFPQIGGLVIEDDVEIGANCTVDRGSLGRTVIRRGAKLDNMVHVGHNVEIGEDAVIAAQTGISGSSRIGPRAIIGGQVGIGEHAEVEGGTILGGQSGVLSGKVLRGKGMVLWGTPARPLKEYLKELATLARLSRRETK
jgi:UDP-3-O-[3-hydroxymyristoyl] glucosamine N-acyltransferase